MIDPKTLNIGDYFYHVYERNNAFSRKKISMIDDQGYTWHRYDREIKEQIVECYTYVGRTDVVVTGEIDANTPTNSVYFLKSDDQEITERDDDDFGFWKQSFVSFNDATAYANFLKSQIQG